LSIFQKFEISLLFASNKNLKKKKFKKRTKDFASDLRARAVFCRFVEKRVSGRDTIRVAAVWQRSRGGLFCFFEEEEEEKAKKIRE
tara:strand:+ start:223 stop:480 length:258 start_codon:yes stop_codon:yes gene_type:complete